MTWGTSEGERNRRAASREPFATPRPTIEWLERLQGFRVEWDDGVSGKVEGVALFVRTVGLGTTRQRLELLPLDDVAAILPDERRLLAQTRTPPADALGNALAHALRRGMVRLVGLRSRR